MKENGKVKKIVGAKLESGKQYEIIILCLILGLSNLIIFSDFIFGKYVYSFRGWGYDTYHQFVPELELIYQVIVDKRFSLMSFQDGLGIDLISIQRWLTDPFTVLILAVAVIMGNMDVISELMVFLPIAVSLCSGVVCLLYLRRYIRTSRAIILAAYMYGICGYLVSTGTHYWFASFLVFFPFLLLAVDKIVYEQNFKTFILAVSVIAIHGAYGAFPMFISAGVYLIYKSLGAKLKCRQVLRLWGESILTGIIGLLISAIIFIPNLYEMIKVSGRISNESLINKIIQSLNLINRNELKTAISRLFSNNLLGNVDEWHGIQAWFCAYPYYFSILFIFLVAQYIRFIYHDCEDKKEKIYKSVGILIAVFALVTNFAPALFNLFNYSQWRMIFVILPFFAFSCAKAIEQMTCKQVFSHWVNICCGVVCLMVLSTIYRTENKKIYYQCIFFVCIFCILLSVFNTKYVIRNKKIHYCVYVCIFFVLSFNLITDHRFSIIEGASPVMKEQELQYYGDKFVKENLEKIAATEGEAFIRVDRTYLGTSSDTCWSYVMPCRSATMYNSILNNNTKEYMTYMVNFNKKVQTDFKIIYAIYDYDTYFDTARAAMLGLKYVMTNQKRNLDDWQMVYESDGLYTYRNTSLSTGGVLYTSYLTEESYERLSTINKACVEAQTVVLNDNVDEVAVYDENKVQYCSKIDNLENQIVVENAEVVSGMNHLQIKANENARLIVPIDKELFKNTNERNFINFYLTSSTAGNISIKLLVGNNECEEGEKLYFWENEERKEISRLLPDDCSGIEINITAPTVIDIEEIQLLGIPITYSNQVELMNDRMGDIVHGSIYAEKRGILYSSIPYLNGWKAYLDGKEVKVLKANYGFIAIEVPQGEHNVTFEYQNPVMKQSVIISIVGVISFAMYLIYAKKRNKARE